MRNPLDFEGNKVFCVSAYSGAFMDQLFQAVGAEQNDVRSDAVVFFIQYGGIDKQVEISINVLGIGNEGFVTSFAGNQPKIRRDGKADLGQHFPVFV